mmetsp:Transcript_80712/g.142180  ORF Transcript_80712/g.142180 Transcript_80712/m.142180 type:complete len:120 (-) Transcript_80712:680-1039(-)
MQTCNPLQSVGLSVVQHFLWLPCPINQTITLTCTCVSFSSQQVQHIYTLNPATLQFLPSSPSSKRDSTPVLTTPTQAWVFWVSFGLAAYVLGQLCWPGGHHSGQQECSCYFFTSHVHRV